jgi:hypothetical protein
MVRGRFFRANSPELGGRPHRVGDGALLVVEGEEGLRRRVARGQHALVGEFAPTVGPAEHLAPLARRLTHRTRRGRLRAPVA